MKTLPVRYGHGVKAIKAAIKGRKRVRIRDLHESTGLSSQLVTMTLIRLEWKSVARGVWMKHK